MYTTYLSQLFQRDLNRLKEEISAFSDEALLWKTTGDISNSAGNLCLHLLGNLNHFIGATLGDTGYDRDRKFEFSANNIPRINLLQSIEETRRMLGEVVPALDPKDLERTYPLHLKTFKEGMETGYFLIHLSGHLNYHLGQINYLRRIL